MCLNVTSLQQQSSAASVAEDLVLTITAALDRTWMAVHQWTAKQFWVDRQSSKQEDNIYCLEKVQINKLNVYLQFKLRCLSYIQITIVYLTSVSSRIVPLARIICCYELHMHFSCSASLHRQVKLMCFFPILKVNWQNCLAITYYCVIFISVLM
jgi:hypothetical protein